MNFVGDTVQSITALVLLMVSLISCLPSVIHVHMEAGTIFLKQWSPTFLAPGTGFIEHSFSTGGVGVQAVMLAMGEMVQAEMRAMGSGR